MKKIIISYISTVLILSTLLLCFAFFSGSLQLPWECEVSTSNPAYTTVIIDAGHGGEDGGTSSKSGLIEKNINLELAFLLKEKLEVSGVRVVLTREDDTLLYDRSVDYRGRKKLLDMQARLKIIEECEDCIFVSLHMNSFSDSRYSGLQVWYSDNNPDSQILANTIQNGIKSTLQPENSRKTKAAGTSIFLLNKSLCPSVLVECGFLSNPDEAEKFESPEYKQDLCSELCNSIMSFLGKC